MSQTVDPIISWHLALASVKAEVLHLDVPEHGGIPVRAAWRSQTGAIIFVQRRINVGESLFVIPHWQVHNAPQSVRRTATWAWARIPTADDGYVYVNANGGGYRVDDDERRVADLIDCLRRETLNTPHRRLAYAIAGKRRPRNAKPNPALENLWYSQTRD